MYINNNATVVERGTSVPCQFTLPSNMLGKTDDWTITLINKADYSISAIADFTVKEIGELVAKTVVSGDYQPGAMTVKVEDSSLLAVGQTIRILNRTYNIVEINSASHLLVLDTAIQDALSNTTPVSLVVYPNLLGFYAVENIVINNVGNYLVVISDKKGEVNNIVSEVVIVSSLTNATIGSKVQAGIITSNNVG